MAKASNDLVRNLLAQKASKADLGAVLDALWEQFEGATGIATEAKAQYDAAKDGSSAKLNMLSTMIEQIGKMTAQKAKSEGPDLGDLPLGEAAAVVGHFFEKIANGENSPPELRRSAEPGGNQPGSADRGPGDNSEKYQG